MSEKDNVGGRAYANGVRLMNQNYSVKAYYNKDNELKFEQTKMSRGQLFKYIKKIPILRGIFSLLFALIIFLKESVNNPVKYWFVFIIIILDVLILFLPASSNDETVGEIIFFITLLYFVLPFLLIFIFRKTIVEVLKYHGAEHKTVHYYENDCQGEIQSYSRLHRRCGSNIVFYYFIISIVMAFVRIDLNLYLKELIYLGIAYEAIRYTPERLLFIPQLFQRLVTREPEEKHIKAAKLALEVLNDN